MSLSSSAFGPVPPDSVVPVLTAVVPESDITVALRAALDARAQEKAAFMSLSDELLHALRPEMERLMADLVRSSLQQTWRMRHRNGDGVFLTDIA